MTRILTIFALLFVTPAWGVEKSSFYCHSDDYAPLALEFLQGKAHFVRGKHEYAEDYDVRTANTVYFGDDGTNYFEMNRANLVLKLKYSATRKTYISWQCEFMAASKAREIVAAPFAENFKKARNNNQF